MPKNKPNTSDVNRDQIRSYDDRAKKNHNKVNNGPGTMNKTLKRTSVSKKIKP